MLSYTWVKQAYAAAGLAEAEGTVGAVVHRKRRSRGTRQLLPGIDAAHRMAANSHWFQDERKHDLIVILDDATSEIYYARAGARRNNLHGNGWAACGD